MTNELHIKNMVCDRCIEAIREELNGLDIPFGEVRLGNVQGVKIRDGQLITLNENLKKRGFELITDSTAQLVSQVKAIVIEMIHHPDRLGDQNASTYLENALGKEYSALSRIFSSHTGTTIEKHIINQRVERAKELISYGELTISEIAHQLGYSSVQHLSTQFKKVVDKTPSQYLKSRQFFRKGLDQV